MSTTLRRIGPFGLTATVLYAAFACQPQPGAFRPECPADVIVVPNDTSYSTTTVIAASGPISMVPEYHDCQRFVRQAQDSFVSLIAIFASSGLDSVDDPPAGPLSPTNVVVTGRDQKAAATILNYHAPYEPLRIEKGFNCLYLFTSNGVWNARIFSAATDKACLETMPQSGGSPLAVTVLAGGEGRIPPVARWDWDSETHEHYIGIRCGSHWCEVYNPSQQRVHSSASYGGGSPFVAIKGWYDEQNLAVPSPGGGTELVPGGVQGTIFPVGDLVANTEADFDSTWKQVALVSLAAASTTYKEKFNFIPGPPPLGNSEIWLCMGDKKACQIPATSQANVCNNDADQWWAKIVSATLTKYRCVIRRKHTGVPIPGAVRWRWQNTDEDMWVRCPLGCCELT